MLGLKQRKCITKESGKVVSTVHYGLEWFVGSEGVKWTMIQKNLARVSILIILDFWTRKYLGLGRTSLGYSKFILVWNWCI